MIIKNSRIVVTGAAGGIGNVLTRQLLEQGAKLAIVDRDPEQLAVLASATNLESQGGLVITADLSSATGIESIRDGIASHWNAEVDVIIHAAGIMDFAPFEDMQADTIHHMMAINLEAPIQLSRVLLPAMLSRGIGRIVFVGSILGKLGMPYFSTYTASKFALRGFAEALRREIYGSGVGVSYIGPRSVKTRLNAGAVERMAQATGMSMDEPELVASRIIQVIMKDQNEVHMGFPESLFVKVNSLFPKLIDKGLRSQQKVMEPFARGQS